MICDKNYLKGAMFPTKKKKIKLAKGSKTPSVWHHLWNGLSFLFDKIDLIYQTIWIYMSYLSR